jgi:all-trans-retinol dehydrogenase (NAD+)
MEQLKKEISITTIMPFYINTGMFDGVKSKLIPILEPEPTAEKIIKAVENKRKILAMPLPYWFIRLSQGLLPLPIFDWVMENIFGVYDTMKYFKGRK